MIKRESYIKSSERGEWPYVSLRMIYNRNFRRIFVEVRFPVTGIIKKKSLFNRFCCALNVAFAMKTGLFMGQRLRVLITTPRRSRSKRTTFENPLIIVKFFDGLSKTLLQNWFLPTVCACNIAQMLYKWLVLTLCADWSQLHNGTEEHATFTRATLTLMSRKTITFNRGSIFFKFFVSRKVGLI